MGYFLIQKSLLDQYKNGEEVKKMEIDPTNLTLNDDGSLFYSDKKWPTFKGMYAPTYNAFLNNGSYVFIEEVNEAKKVEVDEVSEIEQEEEEEEEEGDLTGDNQKPRRGRPSQKA